MKIVRERPCQRRYHRVTAPLKVSLGGKAPVMATNWSLGGLRLDGVAAPLPGAGQQVELLLELPFQGFDISFETTAVVMRSDETNGTVAVEFESLSERAYELMNHFIEDLVRGKMASTEDTICRIDFPVTPISTKPDTNPGEEVPVARRHAKTILMSALYVLAGFLVFGYLAVLLWSSTMRMEITSAVVSAPLATIKMPVDGVVYPVNLALGKDLRRGEVIARIKDLDLDERKEKQQIRLDRARDDLARAKEKYRLQSNRMALYKIVKTTDRQIAEAKVESARGALAAADSRFERMSILFEKKLVDATLYEEATTERANREAELRTAEHELERATALSAVSDRIFFNNKEFVADLDMLALQVDEAASEVRSAIQQLEELERKSAQLAIRAPFDGRIIAIQQPGNVTVLRNEPLLTVEKNEIPTVTAFLDQEEILSVGLNDRAKVFLPSIGKSIAATVVRIDRNSAFLDHRASRYVWEDGKAKSAAVSLILHPLAEDDIRAGLPAVVIFAQRRTKDIYHNLLGPFADGQASDREDANAGPSI